MDDDKNVRRSASRRRQFAPIQLANSQSHSLRGQGKLCATDCKLALSHSQILSRANLLAMRKRNHVFSEEPSHQGKPFDLDILLETSILNIAQNLQAYVLFI